MQQVLIHQNRSSHLVVFLGIGFPKICNKFTGEHPCWSAISKTFKRRFIALTLQHECSPVDLLYIFRTPFPKNTDKLDIYEVEKVLTGLNSLKSKEDKSEVDKLLPVPVDLSKLSGVEENDVINKRYKNAMIKMIKCRKIKDKMLRSKVSKINT